MKKFVLGLVFAAALLFSVPEKANADNSFFFGNRFTPVTVVHNRFGNRVFFTPTNVVFTARFNNFNRFDNRVFFVNRFDNRVFFNTGFNGFNTFCFHGSNVFFVR